MTIKQRAIQERAKREYDVCVARESLLGFTTATTPGYDAQWFHEYTCNRLSLIPFQRNQRLLIEMRPRGGKSEIVSRNYPPWAFGIQPTRKIIACTHTAGLSEKLNRAVQRKIISKEYKELFPNVAIGESNIVTLAGYPIRNSSEIEILSRAGSGWAVTGNYRNTSVGSAIAGEGADDLILDDFLPDTASAESPTIREKQKEWFAGDFHSRLAPGGNIIILATPRHPDDLIGWQLALMASNPGADQWEVIRFPNENDYAEWHEEQPAYDIRQPGELLWPERYGWIEANAERANSEYLYSALYQCRPTARKGNAIPVEKYELVYTYKKEDIASIALYYDIAFSSDPRSDWTWGSLKARMKDGTFITFWQHFGKWDSDARNQRTKEFGLQIKAATGAGLLPPFKIAGEQGVGGANEVVNGWRNELIAAGLNVTTIPSTVNKVARATMEADSYLAAVSAGRCKFYAGDAFKDFGLTNGTDSWINPYRNAVAVLRFADSGLKFLGGKDDMLDAESGSHNMVTTIPKPDFFSRN